MAYLQNNSQPNSSAVERDEARDHARRPGGTAFEIHVQGHLTGEWSDWFEGMELKLMDNGETVLAGTIVDQAALMGILNKLNRLNITLLSINKTKEEQSGEQSN